MTQQTQDKKLCMIPGPIEFHENVLDAVSTHATSHVDPRFINVFGETLENLREVFAAKNAQPVVISGSGTLGWDIVASNLAQEGDNVLVLTTGYFGDRFTECFQAYKANPTQLKATPGDRPTLEQIEKALSEKEYKILTVTHVDTSTGVVSDVKAITELVRRVSPNTLVVVDAVCAAVAEELYFDEWDVDVLLTASQKAIGVPPGLSILVISQRALGVYESRTTPVANYYASLAKWLPIMKAYEARKPSYFATPAVQLIYGLNVALKQIIKTGPKAIFEAHKKAAVDFRAHVEGLGLKLVPVNHEVAANAMTAVWFPEGITAADFVPHLFGKGVVVAGGLLADIGPKYFRVGHMGLSVVEPERGYVEKTKQVVAEGLSHFGYKGASQ
ncbi:aminotransferase [Conidiobolus coronatus NRRL 28638]|uniref:alanine--glyoxylate transaminase n=1 Tax=Conidiobolus coronatus (strain ATCC 28846 / CBS 209.66 / NRRL 28638) TaxID=796925 RepID=A0A137NQV0_CONC2|nr:aminotransferase [Conidiobolus coronatus NRRL 28638]|eukprot:KXN65092.1 aminotransferase [Conidiobolus coronatus NRRL 28638]